MVVQIQIEDKFLVLGNEVVSRTMQRAVDVALESALFKHQDSAQYIDAATHGFCLPSNAPISEDLRAAAQTKGENDVK